MKKVTNTKCESLKITSKQQQQQKIHNRINSLVNNLESNLNFERDRSHFNSINFSSNSSSDSKLAYDLANRGVVKAKKDALEVLIGSKGGGTHLKHPERDTKGCLIP